MNHDQNPLDELQEDQVDISTATESDGGPISMSALQEEIENLKKLFVVPRPKEVRAKPRSAPNHLPELHF